MSLRGDPRVPLRGRASECVALDALLEAARAGESGALVLRGEAGIGKTALLDYVAMRSEGCRVVRAIGVETEMELPFAAVHQLAMPLLDAREHLPAPQRDALETAFGLSSGAPPNRLLVGLAVLSLLAAAAEPQPLVCLVDDAQWLDQFSGQVISVVARRLQAESVVILFAERDRNDSGELAGLPEVRLRGLSDVDAAELVASVTLGQLDEPVRDRIVAEARGNPLALLELPRGRSSASLAGGFAVPGGLPLPSQIEASFRRRVGELPAETQQVLLVAAADPVGDPTVLWRAIAALGLEAEAVTPAELDDLIDIRARVAFRHPLLRSAIYRAALPEERRAAHGALAVATDPEVDPDRRAWHRAHAAIAPDDDVAGELEESAGRAQQRGGLAAAAAFLERAAVLTADPARRGARGLAAAEATFEAGALDTALELLVNAGLSPLDSLQRARAERLRAQIVFAMRRGRDAPPLLLHAAKQLEPLDVGLAREAYLEALGAAIFAGRLNMVVGPREAAAAARGVPSGSQPPRPTDLLLDGLATRFTEGYVAGVAPLRHALEAFRRDAGRTTDDILPWLWLPLLVAGEVWDDEMSHELATRAVRLGRESGALGVLPLALTYRAAVHVHAGEFTAASALIEQADSITEATRSAPVGYASLLLVTWRGVEAEALEQINADLESATARGEGRAIGGIGYMAAVLYNGLGRYETALASAQRACEYEDLGVHGSALVELVEAGARSGAHEEAASAQRQLDERTRASGTDWALGLRARSMALLSDGEAADALYREGIERLARSRSTVDLGRAQLVYGEWLRRENRRVDARDQLRAAHDFFDRIGADGFAERARRELHATGETVRKRVDETRGDLTAQELQIARLAGDGDTNSQIGAQLFLSPRTVEWHLRKVFTKLAISSRRELREALPTAGRAA